MLRLRLLGSFAVCDASGDNTPIPPHRLALLALLAVAGERGIARDKILAHLWPESTQSRARASLDQMLHALRASLGNPSDLRGNPLRLEPAFATTDVGDFRAALDAGDLERAVERYGGPFLDGFYLSGLPEFEEWVQSQRAALSEQYAGALDALAAEATARGDHARGVRYLRLLGSVLSLNGRVACRLMEALAADGDRDGALEVASRYGVRVREQLGVEPDPSVTALAERLRVQSSVHPVSSIHTTPLVMRESVGPAPARQDRRRRLLILVGGPALALLGTTAWLVVRNPTLDPKRVLIGSFENRTGDQALAGLVSRIATEIVNGLASTGLVH